VETAAAAAAVQKSSATAAAPIKQHVTTPINTHVPSNTN
jgi:hypothetical protein